MITIETSLTPFTGIVAEITSSSLDEVDTIKESALNHLKNTMEVYDSFLLHRKSLSPWQSSHMRDLINHFEKYKKDLMQKNVDLSVYEPLDLLLEAYRNAKIYTSLNKEQVDFLKKMTLDHNEELSNKMMMVNTHTLVAACVTCFRMWKGLTSEGLKTAEKLFYSVSVVAIFSSIPLFVSWHLNSSKKDLRPIIEDK